MAVDLTALHWIYVLFIVCIIGFFIMRKDTTLICVVAIFILGLTATHSIHLAVSGVFNSFIYAITELMSTILIISIIVSLSNVMVKSGINDIMISPFARFMKTPSLAYWTVGIVMMMISWFFWPSPAVALLGAVLLPAAMRAGLPALGVAVAMNLFGHGIALSSDFVIQGAPKLTADAAGIPVHQVVEASIPLVIVMGVVTTITAFFFLKRDMKNGKITIEPTAMIEERVEETVLTLKQKRAFAVLIPTLFVLDVVGMIVFNLQGGDATALVGGTAIFIMMVISLLSHNKNGLTEITNYLIEGFTFGFKVFAPVIPIAAFFYLGDSGFIKIIGDYLPQASQGIINDLGVGLSNLVPLTKEVAAVTLTITGAITGLDGSGFSGISLAGSIANLFGTVIGHGVATLTALGQISAIWVGGGVIIPWALIPVAAICRVDPFELARRNLVPVTIGLVVTTIVAIFIL